MLRCLLSSWLATQARRPGRMAGIASLLAWFQDVGITLDADLVRLQPTTGRPGACEVRAVRDIAEGAVLGTIPAPACLSVRTTSIAGLMEAQDELAGGLALILAVMHERSLRARSRWCVPARCRASAAARAVPSGQCARRHGYFQSLPVREYVPLFWTEQELAGLAGTEAHEAALADRRAPWPAACACGGPP